MLETSREETKITKGFNYTHTLTQHRNLFPPVTLALALTVASRFSARTEAVVAVMEKGAKGFSASPKVTKSSLKSTPLTKETLKGKDDSSAKSKKGRKVQFNYGAEANLNFPPKSGGKGDMPTPFSKDNLGKGGKGAKTGKEGKSSASKEPLELRTEREVPKGAKCLMDCEAAEMLQGIQEQMVLLSIDPTIQLPVSFDRGLQYAKRGSYYTNPQSVRETLQVLAKHGVSDGELCMIANVCPETADEVFALVPSLQAKRRKLTEPLKNCLSELAKLKNASLNELSKLKKSTPDVIELD